ncbi:hypothetical protein Tco_0657175 [Tanacetum coccineum]|uniref:Uncharacterized protein n=1 Tax=Tanacetum coccineum TaxID=301880 RepID=A0ABQ4XB20_9ASTR
MVPLHPAELKRMQSVPYALAVVHYTGYEVLLNGGAIDWKSTKQSIFATSSTEAECIAAFDASKEAVCGFFFRNLFWLRVVPTIEKPLILLYNTGAIAIEANDLESLKVLDIPVPKFTPSRSY